MRDRKPLGVIAHVNSSRETDYLYRISIKCFIKDSHGNVLVVKETGRDWWDLPGGGMNHGEDIKTAIAREMSEEVNLSGGFSCRIIHCENPGYVTPHNFWQVRLIFEVTPDKIIFSPGKDADEAAFMNPAAFENSSVKTERRIYDYSIN